jgi:ParB/RepB/Spo0J family partition protein
MSQHATKELAWFKFKPQVRTIFDDEADQHRLGQSLKIKQLVDILCQPDGTVIDGERRVRAAMLIGLKTLDALIADRQLSDSEAKLWQLTTTLHRKDLTGWEKFVAATDLLAMNSDWELKDLSNHLLVDQSTITRMVCPSKLSAAWQDALKAGRVGLSDCYAASKADPAAREGMLALKLAGANRDALERVAKASKKTDTPTVKVPRVKIAMPGATVSISGKDVDMDGLVELLAAALKEARKAAGQHFDVKTFQGIMADKAKAEVAA